MAMSNVRYGEGVTREVGCDVVNLGIKNLCVVTDKNVRQPFFAFIWVCTYLCCVHYNILYVPIHAHNVHTHTSMYSWLLSHH